VGQYFVRVVLRNRITVKFTIPKILLVPHESHQNTIPHNPWTNEDACK
jgi:hypothetical protein